MPQRPNIVYLMAEHHKASATSVYGNRAVPTRFMQECADNGLAFSEVYSNSPICTPSRAAVMTGVHPLVHQVTCHQNRMPWNLDHIPEILMRHGYYTAVAGHYEANRNLSRGWHEQVDHYEYGPLLRASEMWRAQGSKSEGWRSGRLDCKLQEQGSYLLTDRVLRMIDGAQTAKAPFFLHVPYHDPHPPLFAPPPYDTMVNPADVSLPPRADAQGCPPWQRIARQQSGTEKATEQDIRKYVASYYGILALVDDQMRRVYNELAQRGMMENTWVIIAGDHGEYGGEKGMFNQTESLYECLLHVPLIIRPPDNVNAPRGKMIDGLVDLVDLFPTILNIAGVDVPAYAQGQNLIDWVQRGATQPLRDCVFGQIGDYHGYLKTTYPTGMPAVGRHPSLLQGGRTREFSYVRDPDYGDEAYDLREDPAELHNLLADGTSETPQVATLRCRVDEWEQQCLQLREQLGVVPGDRGFVEGWE